MTENTADAYEKMELPDSDGSVSERIDELISSIYMQGQLVDSPTGMLGQFYHLGGLVATEMLARRADFCSDDTVLDVCCYVGGPARYLAETTGCRVLGLDRDPKTVALARRLTELAGNQDRVSFVVEDLYGANRLGRKFSGIWSEASLPNSLDWLPLFDDILLPGGKLAISLYVRTPDGNSPDTPNSGDDVLIQLCKHGFHILYYHDMREWEIEHGWKVLLRQLEDKQSLYEEAFGPDWVQRARDKFQQYLCTWTETAGNAFFVARKARG